MSSQNTALLRSSHTPKKPQQKASERSVSSSKSMITIKTHKNINCTYNQVPIARFKCDGVGVSGLKTKHSGMEKNRNRASKQRQLHGSAGTCCKGVPVCLLGCKEGLSELVVFWHQTQFATGRPNVCLSVSTGQGNMNRKNRRNVNREERETEQARQSVRGGGIERDGMGYQKRNDRKRQVRREESPAGTMRTS